MTVSEPPALTAGRRSLRRPAHHFRCANGASMTTLTPHDPDRSELHTDGSHIFALGGARPDALEAFAREVKPWTTEHAELQVPVELNPRTTASARQPRSILVVLESPYAGDVEANLAYARACVADSLARGEAPIASHLLYTQPGILDDADPAERALGIAAGHAWIGVASKLVVYTDLGISPGMEAGIAAARSWAHGAPIEYRTLY